MKDQTAINEFAEEYDAKVNIKSFNGRNVVFRDHSDRKVVVVHGTQHAETLHVAPCDEADIAVVTLGDDRQFIGWADTSKFTHADDRALIDIGALSPMPDEFNFAQPCPHIAKHGGWMDETTNNWVCFNCGTKVVFTENVK